jgi:hypothetical protein
MFIHVFDCWKDETLKMPALPQRVLSARRVGGPDLAWKQDETQLNLSLPRVLRQSQVTVLELDLAGPIEAGHLIDGGGPSSENPTV